MISLNLPMAGSAADLEQAFHERHAAHYGHSLTLPVELVNVRLQVRAPAPAQPELLLADRPPARPVEEVELPLLGCTQVWLRQELACGQPIPGPAIVCEEVATTLIGLGWRGHLDRCGHLQLMRVD